MKCSVCGKRKKVKHMTGLGSCNDCEKEFRHDMINVILAIIAMVLVISFLGDNKW